MMDTLVSEWVSYIQANLAEVVKSVTTVTQLKPHLAKEIAKGVTIDQLDELGDEKHYLISRLYK